MQLICTLVSRLTLELERDKVISVSDDRVICLQKKCNLSNYEFDLKLIL